MNPDDVANLIRSGLPDAQVQVVSPDNTHYEALVICASFDGKSQVARHQMVYRTLGPRMGREIHALALKTLTPEESSAA
jgi:acid stress-induced BolA-like protein IbaG/YrbA